MTRKVIRRAIAALALALTISAAAPVAAFAIEGVDPCHARSVIFDGCARLDTSHVDDLVHPKAEDDAMVCWMEGDEMLYGPLWSMESPTAVRVDCPPISFS